LKKSKEPLESAKAATLDGRGISGNAAEFTNEPQTQAMRIKPRETP
jgi:hypothetical protein